MLESIPAELGRVIPQPLIRCSQCGRQSLLIDKDDDEPLCATCRVNDRLLGQHAAREAVRELVVPVERQRDALPRFGTGSGEIESCDLVLTMRHEQEVERDALLCRRLTWAFCGFEALLLILAAAAMS